ncbi:HAD family phosphatase [candidate division KSB1 bacterium]|nr:HAD family phosphatase [candidate division KSB1 bacterium]
MNRLTIAREQFQAIIFDLDGVIVDSEILWDQCAVEFLQRYGHQYERGRTKARCSGKSLLESTEIIRQEYQLPGKTEVLAAERKAIVRQLYMQHLTLVAGFSDFLQRVQSHAFCCAIATSSDPDLLQIVNQKWDLARRFNNQIFNLTHVNHVSKPDPALFLYAAQQLKVAPDACMVIEDAPLGVQAAKRAGMFCIALAGTYPAEMLTQADYIVTSYAQLIYVFFGKKLAS